ncbi:hypothetical protein L208DRAFT_1271077 [Tricholoma matsutake]|nr:hypothetical protein L208DRAFT_1271077 [Tricholoma matsutake 945]
MKLTHFSSVNHTRCFAHILNLVAKSLLKQFDVKQDPGKNDDLNEDEQTLLAMAENLEEEELIMAQENNGEDGSGKDNDSLDGWVDEVEALTLEEHKNLEESIWPVKRMLVKLQKLAFKLVHPTTILLPAWKACLEDLNLAIKIMPHDVSTRWNLTYNMLSFAVQYWEAIEGITSDQRMICNNLS